MGNDEKRTGDIEEVSNGIIEETMREIYEGLKTDEDIDGGKEEASEADSEEKEEKVPGPADDGEGEEPADDGSEDQGTEVEESQKDAEDEEAAFGGLQADEEDGQPGDEIAGEREAEDAALGNELKEEEPEEEESKMDRELRRHRRRKKAAIAAAIALGVLVLAYFGVSIYFMSHFFFNTKINGVEFSAADADYVKSRLEQQVEGYQLVLKESDGGEELIRGASIGLKYVDDGSVEKLLKKRSPLLWITALWNAPEIETPVAVEYDQEKLDQVIAGLNCMKPEEQVESVSAHPEFQGTEFQIVDEVVGTQIDADQFKKEVGEAVGKLESELDLSEAKCYIPPKYTKDSPEVASARDAMNQYIRASVTYDFAPYTELVDASVISQWVTVDADMNVGFNQDAVRAYIQSLAAKYDTYEASRTFVTGFGNTVEVTGGAYGWQIDQETELATLIANIQNGDVITREPCYLHRAVTHEGYDFGTTYVEVDLTNQYLFFYQNGQCVLQTDIVTGNPNNGNGTPQGVYALAYKAMHQVLRGPKQPDGSYEWESPVDFWMPFNGGIGFHDATWQSAFGGDRYLTHGSHGCVNMPYDAAAQLYGYVDAGTPVVCHY